jgi:hypothetical protein
MAFVTVLALLIAAMLTLDALGAERNFRRSAAPDAPPRYRDGRPAGARGRFGAAS